MISRQIYNNNNNAKDKKISPNELGAFGSNLQKNEEILKIVEKIKTNE